MSRFKRIQAVTVAAVTLTSGCVRAPDLTEVDQARDKAVRRSDHFQAVAYNGDVVVAGTDAGVLATSRDKGASWKRAEVSPLSSITSIAACPDKTFAALDFHHRVWTGNAGGGDWRPNLLGTKFAPTAITCAIDGRLWVVGSYSTIASSSDGGMSWTEQSLNADAILTTIQFTDAMHGVVTGEFGTLATTSDAGATWHQQAVMPEEMYPLVAHFINANVGVIGNSEGKTYKTYDAGRTWSPLDNPSKVIFYSLAWDGVSLNGVGAGGQVAQLCSHQWDEAQGASRLPRDLLSVVSIGPNRLLGVGPSGTVEAVDVGSRPPPAERTSQAESSPS
ncbi:MAG TPA: YCF48-related protein [Vicinamibacterales bacterium]|nr:YCF48-related protein [Vicinamibacterales bacterium]